MMENIKYIKLYEEIQQNVSRAMEDIENIEMENPKGNVYIEDLKSKLNKMRVSFSDEIKYLENHSEWEKFTIAFFGETNAGKSTILEALRILFSEKERQKRILENRAKKEDYAKAYIEQVDKLETDLLSLYSDYHVSSAALADNIEEIRRSVEEEIDHLSAVNLVQKDQLELQDKEIRTLKQGKIALEKRLFIYKVAMIAAGGVAALIIITIMGNI